mmetsp:Transcript_14337/g.22120  ORF Transcript_14337/g.22120 Transcript_14337/m.22120 type:complete len:151 (+) Transcript_14337:31-483(+)
MSTSSRGSNRGRRRSHSGDHKSDFFVTLSDVNGEHKTIMIWVPLAVLARNIVLENEGSQDAAHRASIAILRHGKEIDYQQRRLTVLRQVIVSARKAADAVIGELGNGDVAAAILQAVRYGGEVLVSAKASGIVIDSSDFESIQQPCLYCI